MLAIHIYVMCFGSHFLHLITVQLSRFSGCRGFKNAQTENKQLNKNTKKLRKSKPFYCFSFSFFVGHPTFGYSTPLTCYWLSKIKKKRKEKAKMRENSLNAMHTREMLRRARFRVTSFFIPRTSVT